MYQDAFSKLELEEVAAILDRLNPAFEGAVFDPIETTIMAQKIPFYPGYRLLDIADHTSAPPVRRFAVYGAEKFFILNFSNEPIYSFNQSLPITLNAGNVFDYARFFFTYVRGRHGRFLIIESVDEINWRDEPPPSARKAVGNMINAMILEKTDSSGTFHIRSCMVFKDSLFKTLIKIESNGFVSLSEEELLVEDMPVIDDTFGQ